MLFWIVLGVSWADARCIPVMIVRLRQIFPKMMHPMGLGGR